MGTARLLLFSTYEQGRQPLALASAAAALRSAGHLPVLRDTSVDPFEPGDLNGLDGVVVSVPMHTAARLGIELARQIRQHRPDVPIAFFGLYAAPIRDILCAENLADTVISGEAEPGLVRFADALAAGDRPRGLEVSFKRHAYPVPDRSGLPGLDRYARLDPGTGELRLAGYVEASRGCAHTCTHCPLTPVYGGRLRLVSRDVVLADIGQQVDMGAQHITFGDPDFFNAMPHSLELVRELNRCHPGVTFDATIKVEHLLEHAAVLPQLRDAGCLFVTSAFESTNDAILARLQKGHTRADMDQVVPLMRDSGIALRPTWVAFTPWTAAGDYLDMLAFVEEHDLADAVQPVQYGLRLLLPPGSPLIRAVEADGLGGPFDPAGLTVTWANPDPRMDALQHQLARFVEEAAATHGHGGEGAIFEQVKDIAYHVLGGGKPPTAPSRPARKVPGLTESWFC